MGKQKRRFIDKKNAVTFHLVHRSQRDPLIADENAPQHVLVESTQLDKSKQKEEQKKFGVFFDDDYDYLQHMKQPGREVVWEYVAVPNKKENEPEKQTIKLPSSVFATEFEENVGLLNKAAPNPGPRPDWDPDVVAALDDDFDFENPDNELDDDFVAKAMDDDEDDADDELNEDEEDGYIDSDGPFSDEEDEEELADRLGPLMRENRFFDKEETKSRFTEYSMSSSVIRRNEQLSLLDDRFEKFYSSYDDPELGALDLEEIEGEMDPQNSALLNCCTELKKSTDFENYNRKWDKKRLKKYRFLHSSSEEEFDEIEVEEEGKKWDCESILTTTSNIYNHPKLIEEPKRESKLQKIVIDPKTGIPKNVLRGSEQLTEQFLAKLDSENSSNNKQTGPRSLCDKSVLSTLSVLSIRDKDETAEEKRERKRLLREYRMERRLERKANAEAFKEEKKRQQQIKINNQRNLQGKKIV